MSTQVLDIPAVETMPADLQEALQRVYDTARKYSDSEVHALRAALNIALSYVVKPDPVMPEMVVMWADELLDYVGERWGRNAAGVWGVWPLNLTILPGSFYLVCPHCIEVCHPGLAEDGTDYRRAYFDDMDWTEDGTITYGVGDSDDFSCDETALVCDRCSCRSSIPAFMEAVYS